MVPAPSPKTKTKAKARYLKAKKERKKKRKTVPKDEAENAQPKPTHIPEQDDGNTVASLDASIGKKRAAVEEDAVDLQEKKPPKRRKLKHPPPEEDEPAVSPVPEEQILPLQEILDAEAVSEVPSKDDGDIIGPEEDDVARSPSPPAALQSFPLPTQPAPPDPSVLARQGLDRALLSAETVDASRIVQLDTPDAGLGLSDRTKKRLGDLGITELFAVQTALLPYLLTSKDARTELYHPYDPPRDVCVSAPTGSGKTLAYVVPIVEILSKRIVTRLRALVILPTRDLVVQVRETFEAVCKGSGLKIATATGQHSFSHEQNQIVADMKTSLLGGSSKVDILICTPGRLIDHLAGTPNFTLQHLRFLVIDEADRLLTQSFQDWLPRVLSALEPPAAGLDPPMTAPSGLPMHDSVAPAWQARPRVAFDDKRHPSCQKLLFSATLTRDPSKTTALRLRHPKYFIVNAAAGEEGAASVAEEQFSMPSTLSEHYLVCSSDAKPLHLFYLLHSHGVTNALIFTKSADSTTRLLRLLEYFEGAWAAEEDGRQPVVASAYSSDLAPGERKSIFERFRKGSISILVASDLISRGIDISHVSHVVNYDIPVDMRKYVHRAGRTARAGRSGDAWSLVEEQEARFFKSMLATAGHLGRVKKMRVSEKALAPFTPHYEVALRKLKEAYSKTRPS